MGNQTVPSGFVDGGEAAVGVGVHMGLCKIEGSFFVLLVAGEFLADGVGAVGGADDLLAVGHEISSRANLPEFVCDDPRTSEMIGGCLADRRRL